jgi:phosphotransferase system HPr (HPr) family protein
MAKLPGSGEVDIGTAPVEVTRTVRLKNPCGLHARPCHAIVSTAAEFQSELRISCGDTEVNGRSILDLMTLCAPCHSELTLRGRGADAAAMIERVAGVIERGFDELE